MKTGLYISLLVLVTATTYCKANSKHGHIKSKGPQSKIIEGIEATESQFPWQVYLYTDYNDAICGGSVISDSWVLTAAHCVVGVNGGYLVFGSLVRSDDSPDTVTMESSTYQVHPEYDESLINDIALIKLPTTLSWSKNIQPIRLPSRSQLSDTFVGETVVVSGWGTTTKEGTTASPVLLWVDTKVISNEECNAYYKDETYDYELVRPSTICALGADKKNICSGDSGGPLAWQDPADGNWTQLGVVSFTGKTRKCAPDAPGGFTRVTSYMDWISNATGIDIS